MLVETQIISRQIRLAMCVDENEIARASLVIIKNDLHAKPYGLLEDVWVDPLHRNKGNYEPIISKDLFLDVQNQLHQEIRAKGRNKEFTFTKMFTCGACSSGITAQEKYKNLHDGTTNKYIYYGCARAKNIDCKEGYIEERVLIGELLKVLDQIDLDRSGLRKNLEKEIERHAIFHSNIMGKQEEKYEVKDVDIRNYAKYVLEKGSVFEKRDLLKNIRSKITVLDKKINVIDASI